MRIGMWFRQPHASNARDRNNKGNNDKITEKDIPQLLKEKIPLMQTLQNFNLQQACGQ